MDNFKEEFTGNCKENSVILESFKLSFQHLRFKWIFECCEGHSCTAIIAIKITIVKDTCQYKRIRLFFVFFFQKDRITRLKLRHNLRQTDLNHRRILNQRVNIYVHIISHHFVSLCKCWRTVKSIPVSWFSGNRKANSFDDLCNTVTARRGEFHSQLYLTIQR